jgi:hypothetical protein
MNANSSPKNQTANLKPNSIQRRIEMNRLIRGMQHKDTVTENGMPTHTSSGDACLDFFGTVGSARGWEDYQIVAAFSKALATDPLLTMKILFWARDAREGAGERRVFRVCLSYLNENKNAYLNKNIHLIPEYGRWDDMFHLENENVFGLIKLALECEDGLLSKWLPRKGPFANKVRRFMELTPKEYRKLIVGLSNTVESKMCAKDWESIKYEQVPSVAMNKYRKAFSRNDKERFSGFIEAVLSGETTIKAGVLFPYQLFQAFVRGENKKAVEAQWNSLPNYMTNNEFRVLPVCDVSGSMSSKAYGSKTTLTPMDISVSLGIYISERNEGPFKDAFMTFSERPTIQYLKGSFYDRCKQLLRAHWDMNTNLSAAFNMLLDSAKRIKASEDEMPNVLLIISDMQFDSCVKNRDNTAMEMIRRKYNEAGYEMPSVVFWNVNARVGQSPVKFDDAGTALVSGCSPTILKSVLDGSIADPRATMLRTVMSKRYEAITI